MRNRMLKTILLVLATIPAVCIVGCTVVSTKETAHVEQKTISHIDDLLATFMRSRKDRAELVKIGRALIEKVVQPTANAPQTWQIEIARPDMVSLHNYLTGVWKVRAVMVGGDDKSRYIEIHIADRPVGVWIYEKDIVKTVDPHAIGYEAAQPWGPAIMFVCDDRRYGQSSSQ